MSGHGVLKRFRSIIVWFCLFAVCGVVFAQGGTPIQIGQNATGALPAGGNAQFTLSANGGETATIQVLALSAGFAPRFRIVNPSGVEILNIANPNTQATVSSSASFNDAGTYTIEISGENGSGGQFVLSLVPGTPLPQPVALPLDQAITTTVGSQTPVRIYQFSTNATDSLTLTILTLTPDAGALISLYDEDTHKTIASSDAELSGVAYHLPPQTRHYRVEVRASGAGNDVPFSICVGNCGNVVPQTNPPAAQPTPAPVITTPEATAASCTIMSNAGGPVNVRASNGTQYAIIGQLPVGQAYPVLGQNGSNGIWYEVSMNGVVGWVSASVTRLTGDCPAIPQVTPPSNAPLAPTPIPTKQPQQQPQPPVVTEEPQGEQSSGLPDLTITITQANRPEGETLRRSISDSRWRTLAAARAIPHW